jgi:hypothetical protein
MALSCAIFVFTVLRYLGTFPNADRVIAMAGGSGPFFGCASIFSTAFAVIKFFALTKPITGGWFLGGREAFSLVFGIDGALAVSQSHKPRTSTRRR